VKQLRHSPSPEDLAALYEERYHRFLRVAEGIVRNREVARDAVQEAFAGLLRDRAQFRGEGSVEGWVWRAVVNAAITSRRSAEGSFAEADESTVASASPTDHDEGSEMRLRVAALPERQRLAVFLRYYADLGYREIAEALEIQTGTVSATLNQAHAALRKQLEEVTL
jgi:RNA polymerase sigma factor (sigma-70 family)